jgi:hypothetical protein
MDVSATESDAREALAALHLESTLCLAPPPWVPPRPEAEDRGEVEGRGDGIGESSVVAGAGQLEEQEPPETITALLGTPRSARVQTMNRWQT